MAGGASKDRRWEVVVDLFRKGDKSGALYLLRALAQEGEGAALREIANIYELGGGGVTKDIEKAKHWYLKSVDEANDALGCVGLARIFYYGQDGTPDYEKALDYLLMVESNNIPLVNLMLGRMYGLGHGTARDYEKAKMFYRKAMNSGNVVAQKDLALLEIEERNYLRGLVLWISAAVKILLIAFRNPHDPRLKR